jgi:DNA-binding IclR family transcriptional regulator
MDSLSSELAEIRERNYSVNQGESVLGIFSIAVAFQDNDRLFAVSVFGKSRNFNTDRSNSIGERLVEIVDSSGLEIGGEWK